MLMYFYEYFQPHHLSGFPHRFQEIYSYEFKALNRDLIPILYVYQSDFHGKYVILRLCQVKHF